MSFPPLSSPPCSICKPWQWPSFHKQRKSKQKLNRIRHIVKNCAVQLYKVFVIWEEFYHYPKGIGNRVKHVTNHSIYQIHNVESREFCKRAKGAAFTIFMIFFVQVSFCFESLKLILNCIPEYRDYSPAKIGFLPSKYDRNFSVFSCDFI